MHHINAYNGRNESGIDFIVTERDAHASLEDFYSAAIRLLWAGYESDEKTLAYIAAAKKTGHSPDQLRKVVAECLSITPINDFAPELDEIESIFSFRNEWNNQEFVWCSKDKYWLMAWGTAA